MEREATMSLFLVYLAVFSRVCESSTARTERLVLHSDQDLLAMVTTLQARVVAMENEITSLKANAMTAPTTSGSTYVRWGRTSCPGNGTELVFTGRMAGSKWDEYFGGANSVCLPNDPTWDKYVDGMAAVSASIYGTEIEVPDKEAHALFGKSVQDEDVQCSVCRTVRPSNLMIAGRATCYPGWTLEYHGYLVSSGRNWSNNLDYVCLDAGLEFAPHGAADDNENVITVVEAHCGSGGSLPCPPYTHGRELACVVCSK